MKEEERMSPEDREIKDRRRWEKYDELYGPCKLQIDYWLNIGEKIKRDKEEGR